jgi:hypothetical protein
LWPHNGNVRVLVGVADHVGDCRSHHLGVGIGEQQVLTLGSGDGLVVGSREAQVLAVGYEGGTGEVGSNHFRGAVGGSVVHHQQLQLAALAGGRAERLEAAS